MARFQNKQKINSIIFSVRLFLWCPIGKKSYKATVDVKMEPGDTIPDYVEVDNYLRTLNEEKLVIEDVVAKVYDYLMKEYKPTSLDVSVTAESNAHFEVTVSKDSYE